MRFGRFLFRLSLLFFLLLLALRMALEHEAVQNYLVDSVASFLSREMGTEVRVNHVDISFFSSVVLDGVYVADNRGDTLLYTGQLRAGLKSGFMGLLRSDIQADEVELRDVVFKMYRDTVWEDGNMAALSRYFGGSQKDSTATTQKNKSPLFLAVRDLVLENVRFEQVDRIRGESIGGHLRQGSLSGIRFYADSNHLQVNTLWMDGFGFAYHKQERQVPPTAPQEDEGRPGRDSSFIPFTASVAHWDAENGWFSLLDATYTDRRPKFANTMNFGDLYVEGIRMEADSFWMSSDLEFRGQLKQMAAKEKSGFELTSGKASEVYVGNEGLHLYGMEIRTPQTLLGDTLVMKYRRHGYPSFLNFVDDVGLEGIFRKGTRIALADIFAFAPELQDNRFFRKNMAEVLLVEGTVSGKINNLKTKGFELRLGDRLRMKGDLRSRNLAVPGEQFFDFELERLETDMATIRSLVPDFNPPPQFDRLGLMDFRGRFTGFVTSFTADGYLRTNLGDVQSDISLEGDRNNARYRGALDLIGFDLGAWTNNPDLGKVYFSSKVENGSGLDAREIKADLSAEVSSFSYKGYTYQALNIGGRFDSKKFNGKLDIKDDNIDMEFNGLVDFNEEIPRFDFKANVHNLRLHELHLSKMPIHLKADLDLDFQGLKLEDLDGEAAAQNIRLTLDTVLLELDSLYAYSFQEGVMEKRVGVESDVLTGELKGRFGLDEFPKIVASYAQRNFPEYMDKFQVPQKYLGFHETRYFDFDFFLGNSKNLTHLISPQLDTFINTSLRGHFNTATDTLMFDVAVESGGYGQFEFDDVNLIGHFLKNKGTLDLGIYHTLLVKDSIHLAPIAMYNNIHADTTNFELSLNDFTQVLDKINLNGQLTIDDEDLVSINFATSNLILFNYQWEMLEDNYLKVGKGIVRTQNFKLYNKDIAEQKVELNTVGNRGLELLVDGFDIEMLNPYINDNRLYFNGGMHLEASTNDVFKLENLRAITTMDTLWMNGRNMGQMKLLAQTKDLKSVVEAGFSVRNGDQLMLSKGEYYPPYMSIRPNYLDLDILLNQYPLSISEDFLGGNVSDTDGRVDAGLELKGPLSELELTGMARIRNATTTVNYLQTTVTVPDDTVYIRPKLIDLNGLTFYDKEGNAARAIGGITKEKLGNFGLDLRLTSPKFIALDTKEGDNELFYGRGVGSMDARFTGDFQNTNMVISATTGPGTQINLPISSSQSSSELNFITFRSDSINTENPFNDYIADELRGLDLSLNLEVTPDAEMQIIIDEQAGDILKGRGNGDLQINVSREGDFTMTGDFVVEEGAYLFTLLNVINKPFLIKKGGTISWDGDPYGAIINLEAKYAKLSTTPYNFILEYLNNTQESGEAQNTTPVDLTMNLVGELFSPEISFDIGFPNLRGRLKNYTDSKLRIVREDENELNRQVLGLIAFGSFFPSDMAYSNTGLLDGGINTLSEMLSNQLSIYVSELLSEVITDVDIDFNYRYYELTNLEGFSPDEFKTGSELEIRLRKGLFNNRLVINAGSNFDVDGGTESGAFLAGDLLVEYLLSRDGRFKIRFFSESDLSISGRVNQTGVGLTYRREFDTFRDLFHQSDPNPHRRIEQDYERFLQKMRETAQKAKGDL